MNCDISRRDQFGFLTGSFEQTGRSCPIDVLPDIEPFLFPCERCSQIVFHVAAQQAAGIGVKLPFAQRPLITSRKERVALCNTCTTINTRLTDEMILKLSNDLIPIQMCNLYEQVCSGMPRPYSDEFSSHFLAEATKGRDGLQKHIDKLLRRYGLESEPAAASMSYCHNCGVRTYLLTVENGVFAQLFRNKMPESFYCPRCRQEVPTPFARRDPR
jgi:hypothetical protein